MLKAIQVKCACTIAVHPAQQQSKCDTGGMLHDVAKAGHYTKQHQAHLVGLGVSTARSGSAEPASVAVHVTDRSSACVEGGGGGLPVSAGRTA